MAEKAGLTAAVEATVGTEPGTPSDETEQLDLLGELGLRLPVLGPGAQAPVAPRRPGRPPGARNRKTEEWIEYLSRRYPSPLEGMAALASIGVDELSASLGCTKLEALDRIMGARRDLAPYWHARKAPVDAKGDAVPQAVQVIVRQGGAARPDEATITVVADGESHELLDPPPTPPGAPEARK